MDKKVLFAVLLLLCEGWYHNVMAEIKTWNSLATTVTLNTDDGVMTITKTGEPDEFGRTMEHYNASKLAPWYDDKETIRTLFVEEGVYDISNYAFYNCNNLKSVSLPIGLNFIGWHSFDGCSQLKSLTIDAEDFTIDEHAFYHSGITDFYCYVGASSFNWIDITQDEWPEGTKFHVLTTELTNYETTFYNKPSGVTFVGDILPDVKTRTELATRLAEGGDIRLGRSMYIQEPFVVNNGKHVTIDLNGNFIERNDLVAASAQGYLFRVEAGCTLIIRDRKGGGKLTGGWALQGGCIYNAGTLCIAGGTLTGNKANSGGAIYNCSDAIVEISGGSITGNQSAGVGGAITNNGIALVVGGSITVNESAGNGGAIWSNPTKESEGLRLTHVNISQNTCGTNSLGGGIYYGAGQLMLEGDPVVTDNNGTDLYVANGLILTCNGQFLETTRIGLTCEGSGVFTQKYGRYNGLRDPNDFFISSDFERVISLNDNYEATINTWAFTGSGTEDDPYLVKNKVDLDHFAASVNQGNTYQGKFIRMESDLAYNHTSEWDDASSDENNYMPIGGYPKLQGTPYLFQGVFDGNGHSISGIRLYRSEAVPSLNGYLALFSHVGNGGVIRNLTLSDTRITGFYDCAPLVGRLFSGGVVENCHVADDVLVHTIHDNAAWYGGLVASNEGRVAFSTSAASLTVATGLTGCKGFGGIVGYNDGTVVACFYTGAALQGSTNTGAIVGNPATGTIASCYYRTIANIKGVDGSDTDQAQPGYFATFTSDDVTMAFEEPVETTADGNSYAAAGCIINDRLYAGVGQIVRLVFTAPEGLLPLVTFTGATPEGGEDHYTLTMPAADITITATTKNLWGIDSGANGSADHPYLIGTIFDWDKLVSDVSNGNQFSGNYFMMTNDFSVNKMVGTKKSKFEGVFDGDGHLLTVSYGTETEPFDENYCAPFRYVYSAKIRNLHITGSIYTKAKFAAGVVGYADGIQSPSSSTMLNNVVSSVTINSTVEGDGSHGGIVGYWYSGELYLTNCVFSGSLLGEQTNSVGGLLGYAEFVFQGTRVRINGCWFLPASVSMGSSGSNTFVRNNPNTKVEINSSYYNYSLGGSAGTMLYNEPKEGKLNSCVIAPNGQMVYREASINWGTERFDYSGTAKNLNITVKDFLGNVHSAGADYEISITNDQDEEVMEIRRAGLYTVTLSGIDGGGCTGSESHQYEVYKIWPGEGAGQEDDPFQISTVDDWNSFRALIAAKNMFEGKYFALTADLDFSDQPKDDKGYNYKYISTDGLNTSFEGVLDGKGHAIKGIISADGLFRLVSAGATIRNLVLTDMQVIGDDQSSGTEVPAPIANLVRGGTIENCIVTSSVIVTPNITLGQYYNKTGAGGLVGHNDQADSSIRNCISAAKITNESDGYYPCGGLSYTNYNWDWKAYGSICDSYFLGTFTGNGTASAISIKADSKTQNCYYANTDFTPVRDGLNGATVSRLYTVKGKDITVTSSGTLVKTICDRAFIYTDGIEFEGVRYFKTGTVVSISYTGADSADILDLITNTNEEIVNGQLTIGTSDIVVSVRLRGEFAGIFEGEGTADDPCLITSTADWERIATLMDERETNLCGIHFLLTNDIDVTTTVGTMKHRFAGNFDGGRHKMTASISSKEDFVALFRFVSGSAIRHLNVNGIFEVGKHGAALIGECAGKVTIEDVIVEANVGLHADISKDNAYHGGVVGHAKSANVTMRGVVYKGGLSSHATASNNVHVGGLVGWSDDATLTMQDCVFGGSYSGGTLFHPVAVKFSGSTVTATAQHVYYTVNPTATDDSFVSVHGSLIKNLYNSQPIGLGVPVVNYGLVTAYEEGLDANGHYYFPRGSFVIYDETNDISCVDGQNMDTQIKHRTLWKDGNWNTLCLPFALSTLVGTPLEGATLMELDIDDGNYETATGFNPDTGVLTLNFKTTDAIEAGVPYIIRWTKPEPYLPYDGTNANETSDIFEPIFKNIVFQDELTPVVSNDGYVSFVGVFSRTSLVSNSTNLYLGTDNTLYYPIDNVSVNAFRSYFTLNNGVTVSTNPSDGEEAHVRTIVLNVGNESETTEITTPFAFGNGGEDKVWFTLDGLRLGGKPSRAGVYIKNGMKVVIK